MRHARVTLRPGGFDPDVTVTIDGEEYKGITRAITVVGEAGECPIVELVLAVAEVDVDVAGVIGVDVSTAAMLERLGWTAPRDQ